MSWLDDFLSPILYVVGTRIARLGGPTGKNINLDETMTAAENTATGNVDLGVSTSAVVTFAAVKAALAAASSAIGVNGQKITGLGTPTAGSTNAATAAYAESVATAACTAPVWADTTVNAVPGYAVIEVTGGAWIKIGQWLQVPCDGGTFTGPVYSIADLGGGVLSIAVTNMTPQYNGGTIHQNATLSLGGAGVAPTMRVNVTKTLTANNTTAVVPVFGITGFDRVFKLYGVVATAIGANHTGGYFRLNDGTTTTAITNSSGTTPLSALPVGSILVRTGKATAILGVASSAAGTFLDPSTANTTTLCEFTVLKKGTAATTIEYVYTTTDAPTSGAIQFFCEYEPLSADGAVVAL